MTNAFLIIGILVIVVIIVVGAYFAFVGSGQHQSSSGTTSQTASSTPQGGSTPTTSQQPGASSTTIKQSSKHTGIITFNVTETDNAIIPSTFNASTNQTIIFNITNNGTKSHDFGIWYLGNGYGTKSISSNGGFAQFEFNSSVAGNFLITSNIDSDSQLGLTANLYIKQSAHG